MSPNEPRTRVLSLLAEICDLPEGELHEDQELVADLGLDSPRALQLLVRLEDELGIELSDEEAARLATVGDLLSSVAARG